MPDESQCSRKRRRLAFGDQEVNDLNSLLTAADRSLVSDADDNVNIAFFINPNFPLFLLEQSFSHPRMITMLCQHVVQMGARSEQRQLLENSKMNLSSAATKTTIYHA